MKYSVENLKVKHIEKLNKDVMETDLICVDTKVKTERVQIWGDFPNFTTITFGSVVEGDIVEKQSGNFKNITLYPPKPVYTPKSGGFSGGVKAMVAEKAKNIEHSQDRKDNSIQLSSTFRDATMLTVAQMKGTENWSNDEVQEKWKMWRSWLMEQFGDASDITETKKPF